MMLNAGGGTAKGVWLVPLLVLLSGCANSRRIAVESRELDLRQVSHFHIALNRKSEKVVYDASGFFLGYEEYAKGRKRGNFKPDVPDAISHYLMAKQKGVTFGGDRNFPGGDTVIISYEELWGWDIGDIIKQLRITAYRKDNPAFSAKVSFSEMTGLNSRPTAKNLVPKMLDSLFTPR